MWFAVIDENNQITTNGRVEDDETPIYPPESVVFSQFPAPNPSEHEVIEGASGLEVIERVQPLSEQKLAASMRLNAAVGRARLLFITDVPGQSVAYADKADHARRFLADLEANGAPPNGIYGYVVGFAEAEKITETEAAQIIKGRETAWGQVSIMLESIRDSGGADIKRAATEQEMQAAVTASLADLNKYITTVLDA